jgi:hypothetical protein
VEKRRSGEAKKWRSEEVEKRRSEEVETLRNKIAGKLESLKAEARKDRPTAEGLELIDKNRRPSVISPPFSTSCFQASRLSSFRLFLGAIHDESERAISRLLSHHGHHPAV